MKEAVILANGTFPTHQLALSFLQKEHFLICCDGAVNELLRRGGVPNLIIGDLDSISEDLKEKYQDILIHNADQSNNDLSKAVNWCVQNNFDAINIIGATGKREDHTIANIALLTEYQKKLKVKMYTDTGFFTAITKSSKFISYKGQQVSIFSLIPNLEISSENLKYPLQKLKLKSWWMGTLNESLANSFSIFFDKEAAVLVYQEY